MCRSRQIGFVVRNLSLAIVLLSQFACSQLATIKNVTPAPPGAGTSSVASKEEQRSNPDAALSRDLDVAANSWAELRRNPANAQAKDLYNYSTGRVVSLLQFANKLPYTGAATIGTGSQSYRLTLGTDTKYAVDPRECHFVPADELAISGKDYSSRVHRDGIGRRFWFEPGCQLKRRANCFLPPTSCITG
jgi:hypothetical protein